jgi:Protein of unknown function (DUF3303)
MDFVALLKFRSSLSAADADAALGRRVAWKYPDGVKMIAEYWPLSTAVPVVSIMSADSMEKILEFFFEWNDVFDIDVHPAVSAEEGLQNRAGGLCAPAAHAAACLIRREADPILRERRRTGRSGMAG